MWRQNHKPAQRADFKTESGKASRKSILRFESVMSSNKLFFTKCVMFLKTTLFLCICFSLRNHHKTASVARKENNDISANAVVKLFTHNATTEKCFVLIALEVLMNVANSSIQDDVGPQYAAFFRGTCFVIRRFISLGCV